MSCRPRRAQRHASSRKTPFSARSVDMVQERRELLLLPLPCGYVVAVPHLLAHIATFPVCARRVLLLAHVPLVPVAADSPGFRGGLWYCV